MFSKSMSRTGPRHKMFGASFHIQCRGPGRDIDAPSIFACFMIFTIFMIFQVFWIFALETHTQLRSCASLQSVLEPHYKRLCTP